MPILRPERLCESGLVSLNGGASADEAHSGDFGMQCSRCRGTDKRRAMPINFWPSSRFREASGKRESWSEYDYRRCREVRLDLDTVTHVRRRGLEE